MGVALRWLASPRRRWWVLALGWVVLLVLGYGGFVQQSRELDLGKTVWDNIYFTLQLAALDYEGASTAINWRLEIARFVAPAMTASTLLQSASLVFRDQMTRWRLRFLRGHTIVAGLGPAGVRLTSSLRSAGRDVVVIEPDPGSPGIPVAREHGAEVLVGDPSDADTLLAAGLPNAARIVAISETDAANVATAATASSLPHLASTALRCAVHLTNAELAALLRPAELRGGAGVRIEFFNLHERAARSLVAEHLVVGEPTRETHLVVIGLGQLGRNVVLAAAQQWHDNANGPLPVTVVDRASAGRYQALRLQHPGLNEALRVRCVDLDFEAPSEQAVDDFTALLADQPPSLVIVAFEDESLALASGLFVRRSVRDPAVTVVVRLDSDRGLGAVLGVANQADLVCFPFLARACDAGLIEGGVREQLARAIHEDHLGRSDGGGAMHRPWAELSDAEQESSRRAADGIVMRLQSIGRELTPLRHWGAAGAELSDHEVDQMAATEHGRWMAERQGAGWRWGPSRDDGARLNPLLKPWEELDEPAQESNRAAARALPAMLGRAGFEIR